MTDATALSFSEAYDRLKEITDRLNAEDVEPDELVPLLRDGKGLESPLRANLEEVEQEVQAIESGKGVTPYRIVSATDGDSDGRARGRGASESGRVDEPHHQAQVGRRHPVLSCVARRGSEARLDGRLRGLERFPTTLLPLSRGKR